MPTFIGFNTQNQYKKFTLVDYELVKRDLANALNIQQGALPGRPQYGTTIWNYIFENQSQETNQAILAELQRLIRQDPRIFVTQSQIFPQENGVLIELRVQVNNNTTPETLSLFFDQQLRQAVVV